MARRQREHHRLLEEVVPQGDVELARPHPGRAAQNERAVVDAFAAAPHCVAVWQQMSVFGVEEDLLDLSERHGLAALGRFPLAMGLLPGRYGPGRKLPPAVAAARLGPLDPEALTAAAAALAPAPSPSA